MIGVEVQGAVGLIALFQRLGKTITLPLARSTQIIAVSLQRFWKLHLSGPASAHKLGVRTGRSRASIRISYSSNRLSAIVGVAGPPGDWLPIHETGGKTPAHIIRPRRGKFLVFPGKDGNLVFARLVHHPGSKMPKRPHRAPAIRDVQGVMSRALAGEYDKAVIEADRVTKALKDGAGRLSYAQGLMGMPVRRSR